MIKRVWIEQSDNTGFDPSRDIADVLVETEDGLMWSASFVTLPYLQRQMELSRDITGGVQNMPPVGFIAIETPHVVIENLEQDTIEDAIDNMMTLGVFESVFTLYSEDALLEGGDAMTDSLTDHPVTDSPVGTTRKG